jgi:hypothetical protein
MRENGPARDGHERLGNFFRDGPQPRGESAREDGDGNLGKREAHGISENSSAFKLADMAEKIAVRERQ